MDEITEKLTMLLNDAKTQLKNLLEFDSEEKFVFEGQIEAYKKAIELIDNYKTDNGID